MEQIEPISTMYGAILGEKTAYNPRKASKPRVKVIKTPYSDDPMEQDTTFQIFGCVYICYAKKTRGRSLIRYLGRAEAPEGGGNGQG